MRFASQIKQGLQYDARDYGVIGDNGADDTAALQAALTAAGVTGGTVRLPEGLFRCTGVSVPSGVRLYGSGRRGTYLGHHGASGAPAVLFNGTSYASLQELSVVLTAAGQTGIELRGGGTLAPAIENAVVAVDLIGAGGITSGQKGLFLNGTSGVTGISHCQFRGLWFGDLELPIDANGWEEACLFNQIVIDQFGSGSVGVAIHVAGHANWFDNILIASANYATTNYGFLVDGGAQYNTLFGYADIGTGSLFNLASATGTRHSGGVNGVTTYGSVGTNSTAIRGNASVSGVFGVGTSAPAVTLDVQAVLDGFSTLDVLRVTNTGVSAGTGPCIGFYSYANANKLGRLRARVTGTNAGDLFLEPSNGGSYTANALVVKANGRIGIGTATPGSLLSIVGLPTSAAGLTAGDLWIDTTAGNVLKVVV